MAGIVYVSGVHGSGKSTLINKLCEDEQNFFTCTELEIPHCETEFERQMVRYCRYYLDSFNHRELADKNPSKNLLVDRTWYDGLAYGSAYCKLGWMSKEEYSRMKDFMTTVFENMDCKILFVNPPLEQIEKQLKKRWETKEKKWREEDFEYLYQAYESYQYVMGKAKTDVLDLKEINLDERIKKVKSWLESG